MILPGATLGMLGGGQLGRMFTVAARTMGYRVLVLDPDPHSPAGTIADEHLHAAYDDEAALDRLGRVCQAVTTEFENVPAETLHRLAGHCLVRPSGAAIAVTQDRIREKTFLRDNGFGTAGFFPVHTGAELEAAFAAVGAPALLKTSRFGYDGKGQHLGQTLDELSEAFRRFGEQPCVLEEYVDLDKEVSVVVARGADGGTAAYPAAENRHRNGILDVTIVPAAVDRAVAEAATSVARSVAEKLDYCGILAVEFFVLTNRQDSRFARRQPPEGCRAWTPGMKDGRLLVNEIAPRPHNSGHYTLDACSCCQFEQQVRTLCGLPLGDTSLLRPAVMVNLLGDVWRDGAPPPWEAVFGSPRASLHLYGKREPRPGRKMGHYTVLGETAGEALAEALAIREALAAR